ncbi:MAG: hypothetical protein Ta2B_13870 [Termitinemataceae bacterium]|nr:MAG: hypothetical protein Ta2B_13870 [Termitinemataceae bacterium]
MDRDFERAVKVEQLRIQHVLVALGYYPYKIDLTLGGGSLVIEARKSIPGYDEGLLKKSAENLFSDY